MRPSYIHLLIMILLFCCGGIVALRQHHDRIELQEQIVSFQQMVEGCGLSDLALTTEARYTRHLSVSDHLVVSMDHPKAFDHFPSTMGMIPPVNGRW